MRTQILALIGALLFPLCLGAQIDMQSHVASDEGLEAYTDYQARQAAYYHDEFLPATLFQLRGTELFERLNDLMGLTNHIAASSFNYNALRYRYRTVDEDLNDAGSKIISFYDGSSISGTWDYGNTWNREHIWPQSKGANSQEAMGYDMHAVRPASAEVNSDRSNTPFGEGSQYYNPNSIRIKNDNYNADHLGSYRGDVARILLYDFITYGKHNNCYNDLYNGKAQLLDKFGTSGVFESLPILIKWHMQDPPSLTEMVRNDGTEDFQGNRNPFIDFPELVPLIFNNNSGLRLYTVTYDMAETASPAYTYTTSDGFITYLTYEGQHPESVTVTGATLAYYDVEFGRAKITNVTRNMTITTSTPKPEPEGIEEIHNSQFKIQNQKLLIDGQLYILHGEAIYSIDGQRVK